MDETTAMRRALTLAADPTIRPGANPRVGCVLLAADGRLLAEGVHRGAGTAHAEVDALSRLTPAGREQLHTAVVTLEPCAHQGRTGPCTVALRDAGVRRVVYAAPDPFAAAAGGAALLRQWGIEVVEGVAGVSSAEALAVDPCWFAAIRLGRPHVTWKVAATLDGRTAAADGSSRWITSAAARADVHAHRAAADAVVAGTGTVLVDDAHLAVRDAAGQALPPARQPVRVVVGDRAIPPTARVRDATAPTWLLPGHDPRTTLDVLWDKGIRRVFLEGGPTVAAAFWRAGLVDRVLVYLAPALLGAGPAVIADLGIATIADAARLEIRDVCRVGPDLRVDLRPIDLRPDDPGPIDLHPSDPSLAPSLAPSGQEH